jgi:hypothetical protein
MPDSGITLNTGGPVPGRPSLPTRLLLGLALGALLAPTQGQAQARAQITPFFTTFFAPLPYGKDIVQDPATGITADERMTTAPGIGVRIGIPLAAKFGVEAEAAYIFTGRQAKVNGSSGTVGFFLTGNAVLVSARMTYHPRRSNFRGILGAAYENLGGDAWDSANTGPGADQSSFGGIVGFGVRANVTPKLALDLTVESFLHSSDPAGFDKKQFQADILLAVGVPIGLGH